MDSESRAFRRGWGVSHLARVPLPDVRSLPLKPEDRSILAETGLPTGLQKFLHVEHEWQGVDYVHEPEHVRRLVDCDFRKTKHFPGVGCPTFDGQHDLSEFVAFGHVTVVDGLGVGQQGFLCVAGRKRHVFSVDATPSKGRTGYMLMNTRLSRYLSSWLAYRKWLEQMQSLMARYPDEDDFPDRAARRYHDRFVQRLAALEPRFHRRTYWSYVACLEERRFMLY